MMASSSSSSSSPTMSDIPAFPDWDDWQIFWQKYPYNETQLIWSLLSLACSIILWISYFRFPRLRRTPGPLVLRASVCEGIESMCFLCLYCYGPHPCDHYHNSTYTVFWLLLLAIVAAEVGANMWRLIMYCNLVSIYRNPFKPERHKTIYKMLAFIISLTTSSMIAMHFASRDSQCVSANLSRDYLMVILYGFFVIPGIIFILIGGVLFVMVKCLVSRAERIDRDNGSTHSSISSLSRERVFRHGTAYLICHGSVLLIGLFVIVLSQIIQGWDQKAMTYFLSALTCGRPFFSFLGWLLVNDILYIACGCCSLTHWLQPRPRMQAARTSALDGSRGSLLAVSAETFTSQTTGENSPMRARLESQMSLISVNAAMERRAEVLQGVGLGFKRELRLELLSDVVESIGNLARRRTVTEEAPNIVAPLALQNGPNTTAGQVKQNACHYEPELFRKIRNDFGVDDEAYARAFPNSPQAILERSWTQRLLESVSEGASGCFFYRVVNGPRGAFSNFIVKQITLAEKNVFLGFLNNYAEHVSKRNGRSLIQYFGCHSVELRWKFSERVYFVVMRNFLPVTPWLAFDLKGATANRRALAAQFLHQINAGVDPNNGAKYGTLRDWEWMDIAMVTGVCDSDKAELDEMITRDAGFLCQQQLLDYSLLVGIHRLDRKDGRPVDLSPGERDARLKQLKSLGGYVSIDRQKVYFFGIIDVLDRYNLRWKVQHSVLTAAYRVSCKGKVAADGISALSPQEYADRFVTFVRHEVLQLQFSAVEPWREIENGGSSGSLQSGRSTGARAPLPGSLQSAQRWCKLWERRRRGLVRERIDCECEHGARRIAELEACNAELEHEIEGYE